MATRDALQGRLDEAEALMPALVCKYLDRDDLIQEFCRYGDRIPEEATAADDAWADDTLDEHAHSVRFPAA